MGSGQIARGQIIKGIFYLAAETAFVLFMIFFGGKYVAKLFSGNLGTRVSGEIWNEETQVFEKVAGDNSFLILLYGVVSLVVCILFVLLWAANVKGSYENDLRLRRGEKILTFKEDVNELVNKKILYSASASSVYRVAGVYGASAHIHDFNRVHELRLQSYAARQTFRLGGVAGL